MKSSELRSLQTPLKEKYRNDPGSAMVKFKVSVRLLDGVTCEIITGKSTKTAGLHTAAGGSKATLCSADMLLESLAACTAVTLNAIAVSLGVEFREALIHAEADLDFRGTLGVVKDVPVGLQNIKLIFELKSNTSKEQLNNLIKLTEKYCVVYQTLEKPPEISLILDS